MPADRYEPVVGLEVHAQLSTATKMFCACRSEFGGEPNTRVCPVCLGLPGALPVTNERAVEFAVRLGLATHCTIARKSVFARKNYFYPDSPKNYQITQFDTPLCRGGYLTIAGESDADPERRVGIARIHLEEDAGKLVHTDDGRYSLVDMNRCGVPLVEIVSEPDIRSPREASLHLQEMRSILRYLEICDGNMEEGSLRCDVNVSVRERGSEAFGVKTEVKNLNSFKQVEQAIAFEVERQMGLLAAGRAVERETLLWDAQRGEAVVMRSKEESEDYRYFPEPDLGVLVVDDETIARIGHGLPELPDARRARFVSQYSLPAYDATVLTASRAVADYFEALAGRAGDAKAASNWVMGPVLRVLGERRIDIEEFPLTPHDLAVLVSMQAEGRVNSSTAQEVFEAMIETGEGASEIVAARGLEQIRDADAIAEAVRRVVAAHPKEAKAYRAGMRRVLGFFVGLVMKETQGRADPVLAAELLDEALREEEV